MDATHYETLGVPEDATQDEIKAAYRILIRKNHPDLIGEEGERKTALVNAAFTVIGDPDSRTLYNADLRIQRRYESPEPQSGDPMPTYVPPDVGHHPDDLVYAENAAEFVDEDGDGLPDTPTRFIDFWDHPVTRRKLVTGIVGFALLIAASVSVIFLPQTTYAVPAFVGILFVAFMWRPPLLLWLGFAVGAAIPFIVPFAQTRGDMIVMSAVIFFALIAIAAYPLRIGVVSLRSVLAQLSAERADRARVKREAAARAHAEQVAQRRAEKEAEHQRAAAERRAARQAKRRP